MSGDYMSGSEYSATLTAALNSYWQTLEKRWLHDAGQLLRGGVSQFPGSPEPTRWQAPTDSWGHLTTCPIVEWAVNDGTPATRPAAEACDGWSVRDAKYVECRAFDVFSQVGDWAWRKREQLATGIPDLAGGPELSSLEEAYSAFSSVEKKMRVGNAMGDHDLDNMIALLAGSNTESGTRAWMTGWMGLAANSLQDGFLATVLPTLTHQDLLVQWLGNSYSCRATIIHAARNNILNLIAEATTALNEAAPAPTEPPKEKLVLSAVSDKWEYAKTVIGALGRTAPNGVGNALVLLEFAMNLTARPFNSDLRFPQLDAFFTHVDTGVRELHSDLDKAEKDYHDAIKAIENEIAGVDRIDLELYDMTQPPAKSGAKPGSDGSQKYAVDVTVVLQLAEACYGAAEIYSGLLGELAKTSYADGQLVGRGVVPTEADTALKQLRNDVESFFQKTTARYLAAGDRIKEAAEKYAQTDAEQKERLQSSIGTLGDWAKEEPGRKPEGEKRDRIDLDPDKEGAQN
ncbi:hypothetical protein [Amycolatopsis sp. TNS106]|uniref:hypothetical protein n=1 Tax=Amycolatopsis sp. TNS106 TaxID=2861750 RepID=UPI001C563611|nr:hypothetical protein [Amycolatopsis sp. TNS106]QXV61442.1 hypothetical protein CVV72_33570 [Amycolatopsis sp. TNS106]